MRPKYVGTSSQTPECFHHSIQVCRRALPKSDAESIVRQFALTLLAAALSSSTLLLPKDMEALVSDSPLSLYPFVLPKPLRDELKLGRILPESKETCSMHLATLVQISERTRVSYGST